MRAVLLLGCLLASCLVHRVWSDCSADCGIGYSKVYDADDNVVGLECCVERECTGEDNEPPAAEPPAAEPPAAEPPAAEPPAAEPPIFGFPITEPAPSPPPVEPPPVASEPPATEPPATEPPATEPPATEPPAAEPPAAEPPSSPPSSLMDNQIGMDSFDGSRFFFRKKRSTPEPHYLWAADADGRALRRVDSDTGDVVTVYDTSGPHGESFMFHAVMYNENLPNLLCFTATYKGGGAGGLLYVELDSTLSRVVAGPVPIIKNLPGRSYGLIYNDYDPENGELLVAISSVGIAKVFINSDGSYSESDLIFRDQEGMSIYGMAIWREKGLLFFADNMYDTLNCMSLDFPYDVEGLGKRPGGVLGLAGIAIDKEAQVLYILGYWQAPIIGFCLQTKSVFSVVGSSELEDDQNQLTYGLAFCGGRLYYTALSGLDGVRRVSVCGKHEKFNMRGGFIGAQGLSG